LLTLGGVVEQTACTRRNHIFLCDRHQVLRTDLTGTCLGSLYLQSPEGVRENCKIEIKNLRETVLPLSQTEHIVISPEPFMAQVSCRNHSHYPQLIKQSSKITVPPACTLNLKNHTIKSDETFCLGPNILHFEWQWNPVHLPSEILSSMKIVDNQMNRVKSAINYLQQAAISNQTFSNAITTHYNNPSNLPYFFWLIIALFVFSVILCTVWYCKARRHHVKNTATVKFARVDDGTVFLSPATA
jgi:hypothetical protein